MEKIWLNQYDSGVPAEINPDNYSSLVELFMECCEKFSSLPAMSNMGTTLKYADLERLSRDFAAFLQQDLQLKPGDRLAIMSPNLMQYPIVLFGALRAGLTVVNVNPLYTPTELIHQLNDSGAETIVVVANFANTVEKALASTKLKNIVITQLGDAFSPVKGFIINAVVKYLKKMVPAYNIPNAITYHQAMHRGKNLSLSPVKVSSQDIAFLQYTGGTTGVAKGAVLTHRNMLSNVEQAYAWIQGILEEGKEVIVTPLPLYHIFSLTANLFCFFKIGAHNVLITNPRDIPGFIKEIKDLKFTALTGVNTLFNGLMHNSGFSEVDFSKLKLTLGGGMAVQRAVAEKWQTITGKPLVEAYGLTETSPAVTINPLSLTGYNGSIGLPIPSTEVKICDDEGNELAVGEEGELCVRGPQVMQGYWQKPDETSNVLSQDGWLRTGDIAKLDDKGFVYIVDRKKDMILVSGFNVYPNEVEQVIAHHPGVLEVGVIGIESPESGEKVKAFIVRKDPDLTKGEIVRHCRETLTSYKIPKEIEFRDELPKTNVGKILRRELRD